MQVQGSGPRVPVAKITNQGLASIAILVVLLWTCIMGERAILRRANADAAQMIRAMRELRIKNQRQPAAAPAPQPRSRRHTDAG